MLLLWWLLLLWVEWRWKRASWSSVNGEFASFSTSRVYGGMIGSGRELRYIHYAELTFSRAAIMMRQLLRMWEE